MVLSDGRGNVVILLDGESTGFSHQERGPSQQTFVQHALIHVIIIECRHVNVSMSMRCEVDLIIIKHRTADRVSSLSEEKSQQDFDNHFLFVDLHKQ